MALGAGVKGITIEFEANTTKLGTALKTIDGQAKGLDKNLRQVNKALKFNPGNTDLLRQKQQLLGDKISQTKDRLEQLKKAQAQLDDDPAVDKTSQDYMELQREIITTESKLKHFEAEMEKLKNIKFDQVGQKFQDIGQKAVDVGKSMTTKVTAPIVGVGAAAVKSFKDVDEGLDIVAEKTGATGKELEGMQDSVKDLATQIPTDFATAGSAVGEVNTRFGLTGKELEKLSGKFVKFADLNNTDVSSAIDATQKAMAAFGVPTEKAGPFLDRLNKVGQETGISMDELTQSLTKNAPALKAMGLGADESATFLGQLEKSGVDSSKVMSGLQKALVNGAKAGKDMPTVMDEIQESIVGAKDDTEAMNKASELFGSKAGPAIATAARDGALDFTALGKEVSSAAGSVDKTFESTLDPIDKFKMGMNQAKVAGAEIGSSLLTILSPAIEKMASLLKKAADWWKGLSPAMQGVIIKIAMFAAAVGPLLVVVGKMLIGFGSIIKLLPSIIKGFQLVGVAFKALGAAMATAGPLLIIAAVAAAAFMLYKNWDKAKKLLVKTWNNLSKAVSKAFGAIKKVVSGAWNGISEAAKKAWGGVKKAIETVIKTIAAVIKGYVTIWKTILSTAWKAIKTVASKGWAAIKAVIINPIKTVATNLKAAADGIKQKLSAAWEAIKKAASKAWNAVKDAITKPIAAAKDAVAKGYDAMKKKVAEKVSAAASWVSDVKDKISNAVNGAKNNVNKDFDSMKKKVAEKPAIDQKGWSDVKEKISNAISNAKETVAKAWKVITDKVGGKISIDSGSWKAMKQAISDKVGDAKDAVASAWSKIKDKIGSSISLGKSWGSLASTVKSAMSNAWNAVKKYFGKMADKLGNALKLKIKIPKLSWGKRKMGKVSLPWPEVSWNAKGGIFRKPTVLAANGGLQGFGEAGAEAVLPIDRLFTEMQGMFNGMADNIVNGLLMANQLQAAGTGGGGDIHLDVYLFPNGPKMREEIVKAYDTGKKALG